MDWPRILAYITGTVDQERLLRNEYPAAENRILKNQLKGRLLLSDPEKKTFAEMSTMLGVVVAVDHTSLGGYARGIVAILRAIAALQVAIRG